MAVFEKTWDQLTREEQDLYLTLLWQDRHSEEAIARFFRTTKGTIVRRRHSGLALPAGGQRLRFAPKSTVDRERFTDLLDLHEMDAMAARGVTPIAPVTAAAAPNSKKAQRCCWPLSTGASLLSFDVCGKPAMPGSALCEEHHRLALGKGRRR